MSERVYMMPLGDLFRGEHDGTEPEAIQGWFLTDEEYERMKSVTPAIDPDDEEFLRTRW